MTEQNMNISKNTEIKRTKKSIIIAACALMLLCAVAVISVINAPVSSYILYQKEDNELWYNSVYPLGEKVTDNLHTGYSVGLQPVNFMRFFTVSEDGRRLFYLDDCDFSLNAFSNTLYMRELTDFGKEPIMIDSEIDTYVVSESGSIVTYTRKTDRALCRYDVKSESNTVLAVGVRSYTVTKDAKKIVYVTDDDSLYLKQNGKEAQEIDNKIDMIFKMDRDLSKIYYIKAGSLYLKKNGSDSTVIADNIYEVNRVYDSGEVYYTKLKKADVEDGSKAKIVGEYVFDAQSEFESYLDGKKDNALELYYFDGESSVLVTEMFGSIERTYDDRAMLSYSFYDIESIDVSALTEDNFYDKMKELDDTRTSNVVIKDNVFEVDTQDPASLVTFSENGKKAYCFCNITGIGYGDMYEFDLSNRVGEPRLIDTDVYCINVISTKNGGYAYFKNIQQNSYSGDLYVDHKLVDSGVKVYMCEYSKKLGKIVYFSDYDDEYQCGILNAVTIKGEKMLVSTDVHCFELISDGRIAYLHRYSQFGAGDLYISDGGEGDKLDEGVREIFAALSWTDLNDQRLGYDIYAK